MVGLASLVRAQFYVAEERVHTQYPRTHVRRTDLEVRTGSMGVVTSSLLYLSFLTTSCTEYDTYPRTRWIDSEPTDHASEE